MAVAQAQHRVRELYDQLTKRGVDVQFAIHPVAGRMPGHMNVLLAEAEIPYDKLVEMDDINPDMPQADVVPGHRRQRRRQPGGPARQEQPDLRHADHRRRQGEDCASRSSAVMNPGFAGIDNELYYADHTYMLFGDAKAVVGELVKSAVGRQRHALIAETEFEPGDGRHRLAVPLSCTGPGCPPAGRRRLPLRPHPTGTRRARLRCSIRPGKHRSGAVTRRRAHASRSRLPLRIRAGGSRVAGAGRADARSRSTAPGTAATTTAPGARVRDLAEFDQKNHWLIDRGDGRPSVNLVVLSFVHPLRLLDGTTDGADAERRAARA